MRQKLCLLSVALLLHPIIHSACPLCFATVCMHSMRTCMSFTHKTVHIASNAVVLPAIHACKTYLLKRKVGKFAIFSCMSHGCSLLYTNILHGIYVWLHSVIPYPSTGIHTHDTRHPYTGDIFCSYQLHNCHYRSF